MNLAPSAWWKRAPLAFVVHSLPAVTVGVLVGESLVQPVLLEISDGSFVILGLPFFIAFWLGGMVGLHWCFVRVWKTRWGVVLAPLQLICEVALALFIGTAVLPKLDWYGGNLRAPFAAQTQAYASLLPTGGDEALPQLRGKCVVVAMHPDRLPEIDGFMMSRLPSSLRATKPEQVGSVVQLHWSKRALHDPPGAIVDVCDVLLIDWTSGALLGKKQFVGTWRQERTKKSGGGTHLVWRGDIEIHLLWKYLRALPRN